MYAVHTISRIRHIDGDERQLTNVNGWEFVDERQWTEAYGRKFMDGHRWTKICVRKSVDGSPWTDINNNNKTNDTMDAVLQITQELYNDGK